MELILSFYSTLFYYEYTLEPTYIYIASLMYTVKQLCETICIIYILCSRSLTSTIFKTRVLLQQTLPYCDPAVIHCGCNADVRGGVSWVARYR